MSRTRRIALLGALALLVALAGTALGTRSPASETRGPDQADAHETPEPAAVERVVERLGVDESRVRELASEHGFGGAVRLLAWETEGVEIADVLADRAAGEGWGVIAKKYGVHPGIGWVMGNGSGQGREHAPGQQKQDHGSGD